MSSFAFGENTSIGYFLVHLYMTNLFQQIQFIKEIDKLKYIFRKTRLISSDRLENDAEHSWHLAMMAIVLAEYANEPIDITKVIKMVLIHDIVEIDSGDVFAYDTTKNHDNFEEELKAAKRIFGILPENQAEEFINLWLEFEEMKTPESKFARSLDRLEPLLQNASNNGGTWCEYDVKYDKVVEKKQVIEEGSAELWKYAKQLIDESVEKGILEK